MVQSEAQLANDSLSVVTTDNDRQLALVDLARILELDDMTGFDINPVSDDEIRGIFSPDEVYANALANNHSIRAARLGVSAAHRQISLARSVYLPRLNFNASLGSSYYKVSGFDNAGFRSQMRDNFSKSLGFSLQIPIFDAFSTRNQIRRAKVQRVTAELELDQRSSNLFKEIRQAYYQAVASSRKYDAAVTALEAVTEKFNYGRANATEFEQAKSQYVRNRAEMVQAKYEMILRNRILEFYNRH